MRAGIHASSLFQWQSHEHANPLFAAGVHVARLERVDLQLRRDTAMSEDAIILRPVHCHLCKQQMYYSNEPRHVPELRVEAQGDTHEDTHVFYVHLSCWNKRFMGAETVQKPQLELATLDVINALRAVVAALHCNPLSTKDAEALLNLLADAEAKLQLP